MPPPVRFRDEVGDVKAALGRVAAHAAVYHVDPDRIEQHAREMGANAVLGFARLARTGERTVPVT